MIETAIVERLVTFAGVTALVSARIFPQKAPDEFSAPYIVYQKISGNREQSHSGDSNLVNARFQLSCWGKTYKSAKLVARQVVLAMHAFQGTVLGVNIQYVDVDSEVDTYDNETKLHRVIIDVIIWHTEVIT